MGHISEEVFRHKVIFDFARSMESLKIDSMKTMFEWCEACEAAVLRLVTLSFEPSETKVTSSVRVAPERRCRARVPHLAVLYLATSTSSARKQCPIWQMETADSGVWLEHERQSKGHGDSRWRESSKCEGAGRGKIRIGWRRRSYIQPEQYQLCLNRPENEWGLRIEDAMAQVTKRVELLADHWIESNSCLYDELIRP